MGASQDRKSSDFYDTIGIFRVLAKTIEKLEWALLNPEDWGLRYSACLALKSINTTLAMEVLCKARAKETDPVVSTRIAMALSAPDAEL